MRYMGYLLGDLSVKEPNKNLLMNPTFFSKCPHTTIARVHTLKSNAQNPPTVKYKYKSISVAYIFGFL